MKRFFLLLMLGFAISIPKAVQAATIFASGTLGPTGIPRSDIANETVRGTNVSSDVFVGVRFFLDQPVITTQIGGHFIKNTGAQESFFGAIVELDDEDDFPDSSDLSTPDVIGNTLLTFPEFSDEVFGDLAKLLHPGWHALVFGSGLFETTGSGGAPRNNPDIGTPTYIGTQAGAVWFNLFDLSDVGTLVDHRFVVNGNVIPEPETLGLILFGALYFMHRRVIY